MLTDKPQLFLTQREFILFTLFLLFILMARLGVVYTEYRTFITKPFYYVYVDVIESHFKTKKEKSYQVLKVKSTQGLTFYTTTYFKKSFKNSSLRLQLFPNESISFQGYLGIFYIKSRIKKVIYAPANFKKKLLDAIASEHTSPLVQSFFQAIFFATPLSKELREKISLLGVSHLVALSGFHLGILWGVLYGILSFFYGFMQQKFFPYRYSYLDIGVLVLLILCYYIWFVGSPASLVRSYGMLLVGWFFLLLGVELVSFRLLSIIALVLMILFPSLVVSLGFWFSIFGVFYIFLLLSYTKKLSQWLVMIFVIPFGIFVLMLPLVHTIFPMISSYQLLSPFLSLGFIIFYPLEILLHSIGKGSVLDGMLLKLFALPYKFTTHTLPLNMTIGYILLSLVAIKYKSMVILLLLLSLSYMVYLFAFVK